MIQGKRNISGIYFRFKNEETGEMENRVFEDLPPEYQDKMMEGRTIEWTKSLAKQLANSLRDVADKFDIVC
jgi:hypothetical protein